MFSTNCSSVPLMKQAGGEAQHVFASEITQTSERTSRGATRLTPYMIAYSRDPSNPTEHPEGKGNHRVKSIYTSQDRRANRGRATTHEQKGRPTPEGSSSMLPSLPLPRHNLECSYSRMYVASYVVEGVYTSARRCKH